jgi:hypothetical protein
MGKITKLLLPDSVFIAEYERNIIPPIVKQSRMTIPAPFALRDSPFSLL